MRWLTLSRRLACCVLFAAALIPARRARAAESIPFPSKPIRLVVYTKPGGAIDTTARRFADVAAKYVDATFVVENKPGAGGIVAMKDVLQSKANGYTLLACTKSNVAKIAATGDPAMLDSFHWLAQMMSDPECVITRRDIGPSSWAELVADARRQNGRQIWVGPAYGGLDHVMAMKTWERSSIPAIWVPFQSGGKAKAELLGGRCVAYVGNPSEIRTNPDKLMVAAVAGRQRLEQFADTPTFRELGIEGLEDEIMWRGFAVRKGIPTHAIQWYESLFRQVAADAKWREFYEKDGIDVRYVKSDAFTQTVLRDHQDFSNYLGQLGVLRSDVPAPLGRLIGGWYPLALLPVAGSFCFVLLRSLFGARSHRDVGEALVPVMLLLLAGLLLLATCVFPQSDDVGAAAIPRLWLLTLMPLCLTLLYKSWNVNRLAKPRIAASAAETTAHIERTTGRVWALLGLLLVYVGGLVWMGYFVATFLFLIMAMFLLGERNPLRAASVSVGWLVFSYVVFARILFVPLPTGRLLERLL